MKDSLDNTQIAQYSEKLVNYFGINPAFLSLGISIVKKDPIALSYINGNNITLDKSLDVNKLISIINYSINGLTDKCIEIVFLMTLIGDNVSIEYICAVLAIKNKTFFELHGKLSMFFIIKRGLYCWIQPMVCKLITENSFIKLSMFEKAKIYENASKNLSLLEYDELLNNELLLKIALLSDDENEVYKISRALLKKYDITEQNSKKYRLTDRIINSNFVFGDKYYIIYLRVEWLYASYSIGKNGENTDFLEKYLILKDIINSSIKKYDYSDTCFNLLLAKYYHISARIYLAFSDYQEMQKECEEGFKCLPKAKTKDEFIILSELCSDRAISIKHIENIEECVKFLEDNYVIKNNPKVSEMPMYKISYHTHYASQFTGSNPKAALEEFLNIEDICKGYSKEAYLHNLNNIAAMKFILKDYCGALSDAEKVYNEAYENNISIEFGRCQNILGCINWHNNDTAKAKYYFKSCYLHFELHNHDTHLWAPLVNLAIVCYATDDKNTFLYTKKAYDFLIDNHFKQINSANICFDNIPKIVVAFLMLLYIFNHLDKPVIDIDNTLDSINSKRIKELYYNRFKDKPMSQILAESSYHCDGKIMFKV